MQLQCCVTLEGHAQMDNIQQTIPDIQANTSDPNLSLSDTMDAEHKKPQQVRTPLDDINDLENTQSLNETFNREHATAQQYANEHKNLPENPEELSTYENMPYSEVAKYGFSNFLPNAKTSIMAIPHAIANPSEVWQGVKQIGTGIGSKIQQNVMQARAEAGTSPPITPEQQDQYSKDQTALNRMIEPFQSEAGFKKALATNPFDVLSLGAAPLTGGGSLLETAGASIPKLAEAGTFAGNAARAAGNIVKGAGTATKATGYALDPVGAAIGGTKLIGSTLGEIGPTVQSTATGVPKTAFETAYEAGKTVNPELKETFNRFASGNGDAVQLSQDVNKAIVKLRNAETQNWKNSKNALLAGTADRDVPFDKIYDAIRDARANLEDRRFASSGALQAHQELDNLETRLLGMDLTPSGDPVRKLDNLDRFKQGIWNDSYNDGLSKEASDALKSVHAGVKNAITDVAPDYEQLMSKYQYLQDNLKNIEKTAKNGNNVAANAQLAALLKAQKTSGGLNVLDELGKVDPKIPYAVAGASLTPHVAQGYSKLFEIGGGLANLGAALAKGSMGDFITHTGLMAGQAVAQNPNLMGNLNYGIGSLAKTKLPTLASGLTTTGRVVNPYLLNLERTQEPPLPAHPAPARDLAPIPIEKTGRMDGGRVARKEGGRIKSKNHHLLVSRLLRLAEEAKRHHKKNTEVLLNESDNSVAKALDIANKNI